MTPPVTYVVPQEKTSPQWGAAFAAGCGGPLVDGLALETGAVALFGSPARWPLLREAWAQERPWFYGDKAYFCRGQFFRITRNAMQLRPYDLDRDGDPPRRGYARFESFGIPILPWRASGRHIVLCPQSDGFFHKFGGSAQQWLDDTQAILRRHTDRPFRIRWKDTQRPLSEDLKDAWALVTFMSNAAVEAALAGVPVFTTGPCAGQSFASGPLSEIEAPAYRDADIRRDFAAFLAANQWTLEEMRSGQAWAQLQEAA